MKIQSYLGNRLLCLFVSVLLPLQSLIAMDNNVTNNKLPTDTATNTNYRFHVGQLALPVGLITLGAFGVKNKHFNNIKNSIASEMDHLRKSNYFRADDYIQYFPIAAYLAMGSIGVKSKHSLKERLITGTTSYLAMGILVNVTKHTVGEMRPRSKARNSFPSGHTATAFMGAELIRQEYGTVPAIGAYTVATGIAFSRLYNGRHWLNDVIAGAGVGILCARIGYWMLPVYQKCFGWNDSNRSVVLLPSYNAADRNLSLNLHVSF